MFEKITQVKSAISIIFPIFSFIIGMLYQDYRIKKSNIREKAKEINEKILEYLKILSNKSKQYIESENYIKLSNCRAASLLDEEYFTNFLINSSIFKLEKEGIRVVYKRDKIFTKHAVKIAQYLKDYTAEVNSLKEIVENLRVEDIPSSFEQSVRKLLKDEFGTDGLDTGDRREELVFALFVVSVCNSKNSYKNGRNCVVEIIKKRFQDLQNIVKNDPNTYDVFSRVLDLQTNIDFILSSMLKEIESLQEDWQNKLII